MTLLRVFAAATLAFVAWGAGSCDPSFDCFWYYSDSHSVLYEYNFSQLCGSQFDYKMITGGDTSFAFNICGITHAHCDPGYDVRYRVGRAIQVGRGGISARLAVAVCVCVPTDPPFCAVLGNGPFLQHD